MKDANLADVHNGLINPSNPTSKTSKTALGEIRTTQVRIPYGIAGGLTPDERRGRGRPVAQETTAVVEAGLRAGAHRGEREAAGRVLLTAGRPVGEVARQCRVTERTATRWAARAQLTTSAAEGSTGGHRAPLLTSHTHDTQAGTRRRKDTDPR